MGKVPKYPMSLMLRLLPLNAVNELLHKLRSYEEKYKLETDNQTILKMRRVLSAFSETKLIIHKNFLTCEYQAK